MAKQYTRQELLGLYKKLPEELKDAIHSADTADYISASCERNNVPDELVPRVARKVGDVLMGVLLPAEFQEALTKEAGLKKSVAQAVAREMNRFVFYPVKSQLEQIHRAPGEEGAAGINIPTPRHDDQSETQKTSGDESLVEKTGVAETEEEEPEKGPDPYRESL